MLAKEIERVGIPVAHICALTSIALVVGSNRVITGIKIIYPVGNPGLKLDAEKSLRKRIVEKSLIALQTKVEGPTLF